jgi:hypothetical protein
MGLPGRGHSWKMIKQTKKPKNGKKWKNEKTEKAVIIFFGNRYQQSYVDVIVH